MKFSVSHTTVLRELKRSGKVSVVGKWVPHDLFPEIGQQRVDYSKSLFTRQTRAPFLNTLVTGEENWIFYHLVECMVGYAMNHPLWTEKQ